MFDQGRQQILGTVDGKVRGLNMRVAQVKKCLSGVCDMCAAGHRVVFDFDNADWREEPATSCGIACESPKSKSSRKQKPRSWPRCKSRMSRNFVLSRCSPFSPKPIESPVDSGPVRDDREREGRGVMAEVTGSDVPADHDPACEPGAIRGQAVPLGPTRQEREDRDAAGHVPHWSECRACVAGRGRSDAHLAPRSSVSTTTTISIDSGYREDKMTLGEQEAAPSPILVTRSSTTQVTTADVLPCKGTAHRWCAQALVRAIVATGDAKILRSDNVPAILDLKCQAAAECRVRHGMSVIIDDTTEYESQGNMLAEMAACEVKGVARSVRVALGELHKKDIGSKHSVPWLVSYAAAQITRGQVGADGVTPHQRLKGRAFRKLLPVFAESVLHLSIGKRASRLPERWSDGLFFGVVERSSEF